MTTTRLHRRRQALAAFAREMTCLRGRLSSSFADELKIIDAAIRL